MFDLSGLYNTWHNAITIVFYIVATWIAFKIIVERAWFSGCMKMLGICFFGIWLFKPELLPKIGEWLGGLVGIR